MLFVLFALATIGLTNILLESSLFAPLRNWLKARLPEKAYEVFECHQCMGTWVGFLVGGILFSPWYFFPLYGFAGSALASAYHRFFVLAEEFVLSQTQINIDLDNDND